MPARTNDFQQLVALIETSLAPHGAKVTESAMITVAGLSDPREIDVLIECPNPFRMKVAYEAKDHKRPLTVTQVEELLGKYQSNTPVPVDKFVIVSRSGFTKGAMEKAAADRVELLTLKEANEKNWSVVKSRLQSVMRPHLTGFALGPNWGEIDLKRAYETGCLICPQNQEHGTPVEYAKTAFRNWSKNARLGQEKGKGKAGSTTGRVPIELSGWKLRLDSDEYPVNCMVLNVCVTVQEGVADHKTYERRSTKEESKTIHHFDGPLGGMVFSQGPPIVKTLPPGSVFQPPTKEELSEAIRSVFPDGITIRLPGFPTATFKLDDCARPTKSNDIRAEDDPKQNEEG